QRRQRRCGRAAAGRALHAGLDQRDPPPYRFRHRDRRLPAARFLARSALGCRIARRRQRRSTGALPLTDRRRYYFPNIVNGGFPMSMPSAARALILLAALAATTSLSPSRAQAALATEFGPEVAAAEPA